MTGRKQRFALWAGLAISGLAVIACGGGRDFTYIGVPSASATQVITDSAQVKADGVSYATITVEVRDNNQNTLPFGGNSVSLATTRGNLSAVVDGNNGRYVATLKSTQTGPAVVTANVEGATVPMTATVTFVTP